jgi:hypothetical protein
MEQVLGTEKPIRRNGSQLTSTPGATFSPWRMIKGPKDIQIELALPVDQRELCPAAWPEGIGRLFSLLLYRPIRSQETKRRGIRGLSFARPPNTHRGPEWRKRL